MSRTRRPLVLAACMLAMFTAAVEATIVATALPTIIGDLGGFELFTWVFSAYLLTQAITIPIYGKLADMYGRKPAFFAGMSLFLLGSALAGFSTSMTWLIVFRALQGLGAGAIQPIAITIIGDIYTGEERGHVQGYISSVWGFSSVTGPALGAFFVTHLSWSLVFWVNLPIGVLAMALLALFLHEEVEHRRRSIDYAGAGLLMTATTALMLALIQGTSLPGGVLAALGLVALACLALFLVVERSVSEPMMPMALWREPVIALGNAGQVTIGMIMIAVTSFVPTYVQGVMGRSAAAAGFALATMSVGWPIASAVSGRLMARMSFRGTALIGSAGLILGSFVLVALTPARGPLWVGAGAFLVGVGMGFCNTTFVVSAQTCVPWERRGVATSVSLFMRMVGQSTGAALYGALINIGIARHAPGHAGVVNRLLLPQTRASVPPADLHLLVNVIAGSLHQTYIIAALLALLGLVLAARIPPHLGVTSAPASSS